MWRLVARRAILPSLPVTKRRLVHVAWDGVIRADSMGAIMNMHV